MLGRALKRHSHVKSTADPKALGWPCIESWLSGIFNRSLSSPPLAICEQLETGRERNVRKCV